MKNMPQSSDFKTAPKSVTIKKTPKNRQPKKGENMRNAGILMPITALPSPYGIGTLGKSAFDFVDFLAESGQHYWQVLPFGPTGYGDSPYQSFSAFASNPYLIDLDRLVEAELITKEDIKEANFADDEKINYGDLYEKRFTLLKKAGRKIDRNDRDFNRYIDGNAFWIHDYALFMAIKNENGMKPLSEWPEPLRTRDSSALQDAAERLSDEVHFWKAVQYLFHEQWMLLRSYANSNDVKIIGDLPIYISQDSAEMWCRPDLFDKDEVAGCPPDAFAPTGQLWGNPLYNWEKHREEGYHWWVKRLEHTGCFCDVVRIDHFRGFAGYYAVPAGDKTAENGRWREGPGMHFIETIKNRVNWLPIIAEDLGFLTKDVRDLLKFSGFPGMKVMELAFSDKDSDYLPHNHIKDCVVYTGTHDNMTAVQWSEEGPEEDTANAMNYFGLASKSEIPEALIRSALSSVADLAIIPMQDWLGLGSEGRLNTPSVSDGNWTWRMKPGSLTDDLSQKIKNLCTIYCR